MHVLEHKNVKFLVYRYHDLRASGGDELIKIRHSLVTDNYLVAEEIQNQDWQYFIERVLEVCKFNDANLVKLGEKFLLSTMENVTVAKRVYRMIFDTVSRNFNLTINDLSYGRIKYISDDFSIKNYSYRDSLTNLNDWISYYYLYGKFPGLDEFLNVPYHKKPYFLKTETQLSPSNLYSKFSATTAKGLVSFHALCALNSYLGGSKDISKLADGEFFKNLTYRAFREENDKIFLSFDQVINLAYSTVNTSVDITRGENMSISEISEKINEKLDTNFEAVESPAMEIQLGVEPEQLDEPIQASTPLTEKEIRAFHDKEKMDYLKKTLKLNAVDLESAAEVSDSENEKLFQETINPTPSLTLDDQMNVDEQVSYREDPNQDYTLRSPLKTRLDDILQEAREKINSIAFPSPPIEEIPNNTYPPSEITTEDIYIDDSLRYLAKPIYFPQPSTDDRLDFEIDIGENEMILFKSPSLTIASVYKKELRNILNKIIADLDLNLTETLMSTSDIQDTKQKKLILQQLIKRLNKAQKKILKSS